VRDVEPLGKRVGLHYRKELEPRRELELSLMSVVTATPSRYGDRGCMRVLQKGFGKYCTRVVDPLRPVGGSKTGIGLPKGRFT